MIIKTEKTIAEISPYVSVRALSDSTDDIYSCPNQPIEKAVCLSQDQFKYVRMIQEQNYYLKERLDDEIDSNTGYSLMEVITFSILSSSLVYITTKN